MSDSPAAAPPLQNRVTSLDAYRGFVMLAMASAGLGLSSLANRDPENILISFIAAQTEHSEWRGSAFWDLIQPSFLFLVGASIPFSVASRKAKGSSNLSLLGHAVMRSLILIILGLLLASNGAKQTDWTFTNVLAQIGLGYTFVFILSGLPVWGIVAAIVVILGLDWAAFASFNFTTNGSFAPGDHGWTPGWRPMTGFFFHWEKNVNIAWAFDRWFLNLFPRPDGVAFRYNPGGYTTLNFVPSMATILMGVLAGKYLQASTQTSANIKGRWLFLVGAFAIVAGHLMDQTICPSVKRIWTPSWTIYSGGWAALMLAAFVALFDGAPRPRLAFPLIVVGSNSIAMYLMAQLLKPWIRSTLLAHGTTAAYALGLISVVKPVENGPAPGIFPTTSLMPVLQSSVLLLCLWLICLWMYQRRIFIKI